MKSARRIRPFFFSLGDGVFLVVVSGLATMTMHHAHEMTRSFVLAMLAGMAAAMLVQMFLAMLVAPLLGSIESMVPSMIIAMISPMSVCTSHLLGFKPEGAACGLIGGAFGAGMFVCTMTYGIACRRSLRRWYPGP